MIRLRKPDVTLTVLAGSSQTSEEALSKMGKFTMLAMKYGLVIVDDPEGSPRNAITVKGRPRQVAAFQAEHRVLSVMGVV